MLFTVFMTLCSIIELFEPIIPLVYLERLDAPRVMPRPSLGGSAVTSLAFVLVFLVLDASRSDFLVGILVKERER
jgi:hypothetical protein